MPEPLEARPDLLEKKILDRVAELIRYSPELRASLSDLIAALKEQGFEGVVTTESAIRFGAPLQRGRHHAGTSELVRMLEENSGLDPADNSWCE